MSDRIGDWIQTFKGIKFYPFDPRPEEVDIEDIAHALSMLCRFTGHTKTFYSVAQHSIGVSFHCGDDALWGLMHDASEAYLADIARPVKKHAGFHFYRQVEDSVMNAVCSKFGLNPVQPKSVTEADELLLVSEARDFMSPLVPGWQYIPENGYKELPYRITSVSPEYAEKRFLTRFEELKRHSTDTKALVGKEARGGHVVTG